MQDLQRERWIESINALKDACKKSHAAGPGGSTMCICGASCGGSKACSALSYIRSMLRRMDDLCEGENDMVSTFAEYL